MSLQDAKRGPRRPLIIEAPRAQEAQPEGSEQTLSFPPIITINTRHYVRRSDLDHYKSRLYAHVLGVAPIEPPPMAIDLLVPLRDVARELGVGDVRPRSTSPKPPDL
jgi:hypothetical protein